MAMKIQEERVWAGTETSLKTALEADEAIAKQLAAGQYEQDGEEEERPRLLEIQNGIAVISIKGSLNNDSGFWNEVYGMTGYPEIRDALIAAVNDPEVKQILLDIDSGGGAVSGVSDTGNLIRMINDHVKPVTTFTDGTMASAAYWLGCSAGEVYSGRTAVVGSIGVISTHKEYSKMYADAGIGITVVRAGQYKALANSVEPLSPEGKKQIQQVVDAAYQVFVEHVAEMRGYAYTYADETMAQGQEFVGEAAVKCGLVNSLSTFDEVIGALQAKVIDASNNFMDNRGKPKMPMMGHGGTQLSGEQDMSKQALTAQAIAAIASGATAATASTPTIDVPNGDGITNVQPVEGAAPVVTAPVENQEPVAANTESAVQTNIDISAATVQLLKEQLAAKDDALLKANVQSSKLEEALAAATASQAPLMAIVCKATANIQVALGGSALDMSAMTPEALVAEHARLEGQFVTKFKAGGVAAVSAGPEAQDKPQISPRFRAQVAAAGFHKK